LNADATDELRSARMNADFFYSPCFLGNSFILGDQRCRASGIRFIRVPFFEVLF
jgi:hypothetical protein